MSANQMWSCPYYLHNSEEEIKCDTGDLNKQNTQNCQTSPQLLRFPAVL